MKRFYIIMCLSLLATFGVWAQVPQKGTKAYEYYQKAITGDAEAQYLLGSEYEKQNDYVSAVNWYRKAAKKGNYFAIEALEDLGYSE